MQHVDEAWGVGVWGGGRVSNHRGLIACCHNRKQLDVMLKAGGQGDGKTQTKMEKKFTRPADVA